MFGKTSIGLIDPGIRNPIVWKTLQSLQNANTAESVMNDKQKMQEALEIGVKYGGIDGAHHKAWVIDQMIRVLSGDKYEQIVADSKSGEDGPDTYEWDEGIAP